MADFRVNPLQLPEPVRQTPLDFAPLAAVGDVIAANRRRQQVIDALSGATDASGNVDFDKAGSALAQQGLLEEGRPLLALAQQKQQFTQRRGEVERELTERERHNKAIEDAAKSGRVPFGWEPDPTAPGGYRPIAGGPQDPAYIARVAEGKAKPRELSISDISKLSEEGGKFGTLANFADQFQDKYAGYVSPTVGGAAMAAGRYLPSGVVPKDISEAAGFWQGYDRFKNVTRNELYGAALTLNEQRAFEQADINPGMQPEQIRNNLKIQQDIVRNGLARKANAAIRSGYDPEAIAAAYGLKLGDLGVDASGRRGTVTPTAPQLGQVKIPMDAVNDLRSRPDTPKARRQFDEIFGEGAADRVLGRAR